MTLDSFPRYHDAEKEVLLGLVWNNMHHKGPAEPKPKSKSDISPRRTRRARRKKVFFLRFNALYYPVFVSFVRFVVTKSM
jgi:hypothetical protein